MTLLQKHKETATERLAVQIQDSEAFLHTHLQIGITKFEHKALAQFYVNPALGCGHGCLFCYVADITNKQRELLAEWGIHDPKLEWGDYALPRMFNEKTFRASLRKAHRTPDKKLRLDAPRAVMFSTTSDPFQVSRHPNSAIRKMQTEQLCHLFTRSMEIIRDESELKVRILTRSPLAREHFDLMRSFGDRLLFGMSIPTLDDSIARKYEPHAPGVSQRLKTLQAAKEAGLHVYLATAPTFPEQDAIDYLRLLEAVAPLDPVTIYHEPINRRGSNVELMRRSMEERNLPFPAEVFEDDAAWARYAGRSLREFEKVTTALGLADRLKLWPDKALKRDTCLQAVVDAGLFPNPLEATRWIKHWWDTPVRWAGEISNPVHS